MPSNALLTSAAEMGNVCRMKRVNVERYVADRFNILNRGAAPIVFLAPVSAWVKTGTYTKVRTSNPTHDLTDIQRLTKVYKGSVIYNAVRKSNALVRANTGVSTRESSTNSASIPHETECRKVGRPSL